MNVQRIIFESRKFIEKNSSTILTCIGAAGVVATTALAINATTKAVYILDDAEDEKGEELTTKEKIKTVGPIYIPTILTGTSTIACIFGANILNKKQQAALTSVYTMVNNSYNEYRNKVQDIYGDEADNTIKNEISKQKYKQENIEWELGCNEVVFFDEYSGRFFKSTMQAVQEAEYKFNRNFALREYADLNEFYDFLGLERTEEGDILGWSFDAGVQAYGYTWIDFYHELVENEDGSQYYRIGMPFGPTADYMDF